MKRETKGVTRATRDIGLKQPLASVATRCRASRASRNRQCDISQDCWSDLRMRTRICLDAPQVVSTSIHHMSRPSFSSCSSSYQTLVRNTTSFGQRQINRLIVSSLSKQPLSPM
jgi:hypothetical protein